MRLTAILLLRTLLVLPTPVLLPFTPLKPLPADRPGPVAAHVNAVVFGSGGIRPDPDVVTVRCREVQIVVEYGKFPRPWRKVLAMHQLVTVHTPGIGQDLETPVATSSSGVRTGPRMLCRSRLSRPMRGVEVAARQSYFLVDPSRNLQLLQTTIGVAEARQRDTHAIHQ